MDQTTISNYQRKRRVNRTRAKVFGTKARPRLTVFRGNRSMSAQLIDDEAHTTLVAASSKELGGKKMPKADAAGMVGALIAEKAVKAGITQAVFDRRHYQYHGRVKSLAEGARKGGLQF